MCLKLPQVVLRVHKTFKWNGPHTTKPWKLEKVERQREREREREREKKLGHFASLVLVHNTTI
jgi:hypothetical protein